jgi:hypothetical protein
MVSELDWEYLQLMRDIEEKAGSNQPENPVESAPRRTTWSIRAPLGRTILLAVILILAIALVYTAYLAGIFGTTDGQRGIWREAYRNRTDRLEMENSDLYRMLVAAREGGEEWESIAEGCLSDLEKCRLQLSEAEDGSRGWESRYWEARLSLNGTLGELARMEMERDEWKEEHASTLERLRSLENEHDRLELELASSRADLEASRVNEEQLRQDLRDRSMELAGLQVMMGLLHINLGIADDEVDAWVQKYHRLELDYRDLLCEMRFCRSEKAGLEELVEQQLWELDGVLAELDACRESTGRILIALETIRGENRELRLLHDSMLAELETAVRERDRLLTAYRRLLQNQTQLLGERNDLREYCENLTELLIEAESDRDHWQALYQQVSLQLSICSGEADYWESEYQLILQELDIALAEIQVLSEQLDNCTVVAEEWMSLYQSIQVQLAEALAEIDYWRDLYMDLANITMDISIDNLVVLERIGGKPSVVSADITVCVSTVDTPMFLLLEFWGEPIDCIWGYGSIAEDISEWPGNCKVFSVTMDFGMGVPPYKVVAKATLRPVSGFDQAEEEGPP